MRDIAKDDILGRMRRDNPWWVGRAQALSENSLPKRDFYAAFYHLVSQKNVKRAVVLMGPRRVGKTVMSVQSILELLRSGVRPNRIFFASLDTPLMVGQDLEKLLRLYLDNFGEEEKGGYVYFDEIQYLKNWEVHLKSLVDSYPNIKFIVTGSAAAVLKRGSMESGAGRFTDFILPPLTFREYLRFVNLSPDMPITELNSAFMDYLAYGGYPEIVLNKQLRDNPDRYLFNDIIDKVLLRDLPGLYGISDIQEMYRLFSVLVYNTGQEVSLEKLASLSEISKVTIRKYITYFEGAFLLRRLDRVDINAKNFKRARTFKIHIINPSMYSALFGPPEPDDENIGPLIESAFISQYTQFMSSRHFRYARWRDGEVDFVWINPKTQKPINAVEVKWSDRVKTKIGETANLVKFADENNLQDNQIWLTTRTYEALLHYRRRELMCLPTARACAVFSETFADAMSNRFPRPENEQPELPL